MFVGFFLCGACEQDVNKVTIVIYLFTMKIIFQLMLICGVLGIFYLVVTGVILFGPIFNNTLCAQYLSGSPKSKP